MARSALAGPVDDPLELLMTDLANWAPPMSPRAERELSDRVLLGCNWDRFEPEGYRDPVYWKPLHARDAEHALMFAEGRHPHPLQRLDDALAIFPPGWMVVEMRLLNHPRLWMAGAVQVINGKRLSPMHVCLSVAVCSAAVLAWAEERSQE